VYRETEKGLRIQCQNAIRPAIDRMAQSAQQLEAAKRSEAAARAAAADAQRRADAATDAFAQKQVQEMERGARKAI
jgi:hypothetical protein